MNIEFIEPYMEHWMQHKKNIHPKYTLNYKAAYYQKRKTFKYLFTIRASPHATEMKKYHFYQKKKKLFQ